MKSITNTTFEIDGITSLNVALVGGGAYTQPGKISLSNNVPCF